jgi:hypothetical protein
VAAGFFLDTPDEAPRRVRHDGEDGSTPELKPLDLLAERTRHRLEYGEEPPSWRVFRYRMRELERKDARAKLFAADGARMGQLAEGDKWERWRAEMSRAAGLT